MSSGHRQLMVEPVLSHEPVVGRLLWMLQDGRQRTLGILNGIRLEALDWIPPAGINSIGTLLYHIAAIEMDWLFNEIMQGQMAQTVWDDFQYPVRDDLGQLWLVTEVSLKEHLRRLESVRALLLDALTPMTVAELRRPRQLTDYDVTPEWVIHHLLQHEAGHRGEMATVRALAEFSL